MKPLKTNVSITLDNDVVERIRSYSEADDRSFSQYIKEKIKNHVRKLEQKSDNKS